MLLFFVVVSYECHSYILLIFSITPIFLHIRPAVVSNQSMLQQTVDSHPLIFYLYFSIFSLKVRSPNTTLEGIQPPGDHFYSVNLTFSYQCTIFKTVQLVNYQKLQHTISIHNRICQSHAALQFPWRKPVYFLSLMLTFNLLFIYLFGMTFNMSV